MLGYSHPMKNTNLPSWFYKEERAVSYTHLTLPTNSLV